MGGSMVGSSSTDIAALHRALTLGQVAQSANAAKRPAPTQLNISIKIIENGYLVEYAGKTWLAVDLEALNARITSLVAAAQMDSKD